MQVSERAEKLEAITGGKVEWYSTRAALTKAEGAAGVEWDGAANEYRAAGKPRAIRSDDGSWSRPAHGTGRAYLLTKAECEAEGLTPGIGNYGDSVR